MDLFKVQIKWEQSQNLSIGYGGIQFNEWVKKYSLKIRCQDCQLAIRWKSEQIIIKAQNRNKSWDLNCKGSDMEVFINNSRRGNCLNQRNRKQ